VKWITKLTLEIIVKVKIICKNLFFNNLRAKSDHPKLPIINNPNVVIIQAFSI
jgi:hypothetical protein